MPKEEKKVPTYLTAEDVQRVLRAIEADYEIKAAQGQAQPGKILGHSSVTVTQRYAHLAPGVMMEAMEATFGDL